METPKAIKSSIGDCMSINSSQHKTINRINVSMSLLQETSSLNFEKRMSQSLQRQLATRQLQESQKIVDTKVPLVGRRLHHLKNSSSASNHGLIYTQQLADNEIVSQMSILSMISPLPQFDRQVKLDESRFTSTLDICQQSLMKTQNKTNSIINFSSYEEAFDISEYDLYVKKQQRKKKQEEKQRTDRYQTQLMYERDMMNIERDQKYQMKQFEFGRKCNEMYQRIQPELNFLQNFNQRREQTQLQMLQQDKKVVQNKAILESCGCSAEAYRAQKQVSCHYSYKSRVGKCQMPK